GFHFRLHGAGISIDKKFHHPGYHTCVGYSPPLDAPTDARARGRLSICCPAFKPRSQSHLDPAVFTQKKGGGRAIAAPVAFRQDGACTNSKPSSTLIPRKPAPRLSPRFSIASARKTSCDSRSMERLALRPIATNSISFRCVNLWINTFRSIRMAAVA